MKDNLYELSDCLFQFRRWFLEYMAGRAALTPDQTRLVSELLLDFGQTALKHAHELSRHRWSEDARAHSDVVDLVDVAMQPGSNVVLLSGFLHHQTSDASA